MGESATIRQERRAATARRITRCAQVLADERGLDGFTLDDLATAADVSRRTLFNYFPSKVDAVLGRIDEPDHAAVAVFRDGGPDGVLLDDLGVLFGVMLDDQQIEREDAARIRRLLLGQPRLLAAAHAGMQRYADLLTALILDREGDRLDPADIQILVRTVLGLFDTALDRYLVTDDDRSLRDLYADGYARLRALFAPTT